MADELNADGMTEQERRLNDKLRRELGETVLAALANKEVTEVMLNPNGTLWERRHNHKDAFKIGSMTESRAKNLIGTIASMLGLEVNTSNPRLQGELPLDGSRVQASLPPIVIGPSFNIRKRALKVFTFDDYEAQGVMTAEQRATLEDYVRQRRNILVVGGTDSGKTTFCNAIIDRIVDFEPGSRFVIIEDTRELQCTAENKVEMKVAGDITMMHLLSDALRMAPDRIVVGEVRGGAMVALKEAWNTGHKGGVATIHANSAVDAFSRIESMIEEAGLRPVKRSIAASFDCIVSIQKGDGSRRIEQIVTVEGVENGEYKLHIL